MTIEEIRNKRLNLVQSIRENGAEGIYKLLTELYPDNAHFIYELLQNAEDTQATQVSFILHEDFLEFRHNGKRLFTEKDIETITNFATSTKSDDINKIGKFGVGFKAVFAYTATPKIYSGKYSFQIVDFLIPEIINDINRDKNETIMHFVFDNPKKSKKQAYEEIEHGIEKLHDNTLLFLNNIVEINIAYAKTSYSIKRNEINDIQVEIYNSKINNISRWLRFKKYLPDNNSFYVSVAYKIFKNEKTNLNEVAKINGEVSIFFPAEKETSKLNFHIHAPFLSTVARDSIKDLSENKNMIQILAETLEDSFEYFKANNLLTMSLLEILPNKDDNLSELYIPILEKCLTAFRTKKLMLTDDGYFEPSNNCYRGSANLKKIITKDDLCILQDKPSIHWSKNAPQRNGRADKFITNLEIKEFSDKNFIDIIESMSETKIEKFFTSKSDEWYLDFYVFLFNNKELFDVKDFTKFIKLKDGNINIYSDKCRFESEFKVKNLLYVKQETYTISSNKDNNNKAKEFLKMLGVADVELEDEIEEMLTSYDDGSYIPFKEHIEHLKHFKTFYEMTTNEEIFLDRLFLNCTDKNNKKIWRNINETIYMDEPYKHTGLSILPNVNFLDAIYFKEFSKKEQQSFIDFLLNIGVRDKLKVIQVDIKDNQFYEEKINRKKSGRTTKFEDSRDWQIDNLEEFLKSNNIEVSKIIWMFLLNIEKTYLKAYYQASQSVEKRILIDSQLVHSLKKYAWIPDKSGKFYKPCDVDIDNLQTEFKYIENNESLKAIGLGENIKKVQQLQDPVNMKIKEQTGFSLDILEEAKKAGVTESEFRDFIDKKILKKIEKEEKKYAKTLAEGLNETKGNGNAKEFANHNSSGNIITDDDEYNKAIKNERDNNDEKFHNKTNNIKTQTDKAIKRTRNFLEKQYRGHCQICGDTFQYKGENYFKISSLNKGENRDVNVKGNTLCLCPKHWTLFELNLKEFIFWDAIKDEDEFTEDVFEKAFGPRCDIFSQSEAKEAFYNINDEDNFLLDDVRFLEIKIFGKIEYIKITKTHELEIINELNRNNQQEKVEYS